DNQGTSTLFSLLVSFSFSFSLYLSSLYDGISDSDQILDIDLSVDATILSEFCCGNKV
ncbi:MAG: hypothetical protein EZS28_056677, partial [Streblomastix strix]